MALSEYEVRKAKAVQLKEMGIIPYANKFDKKDSIEWLNTRAGDDFRDVETIIQWPQLHYKTAGRLTLYRTHGKLSFAKLLDESGEIQLMFHKDACHVLLNETGEFVDQLADMSAFKIFEKFIDVGDFIGVVGELFVTHKWELTLFVSQWQLLSKAIRPLWDKFHGIGEWQETAYRQRYLDMIFNRETLERMKQRSHFTKALRDFYHNEGFIELETPILWTTASGAAAKPFTTHHNDFDLEMYLRIAPEIALKKATVGMLEKVFEIGKDFRNEGSDPSHHQEFSVAEHYATYWNYEDNMLFTEKMFDYLFDNVGGLKRKVQVADKQWVIREVDFTTPWQRIDYTAQIKKDSGIDVNAYSAADEAKLRADIKAGGHTWEWIDTQTTATMIDYLYKKVTRPHIVWPAFIFNYPKTMQPLARASDANGNIVEQWQLLVNGWELIKAYSELVDPIEQQANFDSQADALAKWDDEATKWDDDFVLSMEYGMPPQSGWGMGIDRIFSILTEQANVRDVILFPMMKPEAGNRDQGLGTSSEEKDLSTSSRWHSIDVAVVVPPLPSIEQAEALTETYLKDTLRHSQQVGQVMKYFGNKLGQDENYWYIVGLLHDIDWDHIEKVSDNHLKDEFEKIIDSLALSDSAQLKADIRSHAPFLTGVEPSSLIQKYIISIDELSGLIHAYSLMRPEWLDNIERSSLNKKIKDKKFAAGVDREHVKNCEKYLGIPLNEFAMEVIEAMKSS